MNIFKETAKFIAWLSGSLAGVGAILIACGYLITIAKLHLLGLDFLILNYDAQYYLRRGGSFFPDIAYEISRTFLALLLMIVLLSTIFVLLYSFLIRASSYARLKSFINKIRDHLSRHSLQYRSFVLVFLLIILLYQLLPRLEELFINPLKVSNLLYDVTEQQSASEKNTVIRFIEEGRGNFHHVLISVVMSGAILLIAWRVTSTLPLRVILVSPFMIVFIIYVLLLPMVYGLFRTPIEFSPIEISPTNRLVSKYSGTFYLVNKTDKEFVLWNRKNGKLLWIPKDEVSAASVGRSESFVETHKEKGNMRKP